MRGVYRLSEPLNSHRGEVHKLYRDHLEPIFNEAICIGERPPRVVDLYDEISEAAIIFSAVRFKGHRQEMSRKHL